MPQYTFESPKAALDHQMKRQKQLPAAIYQAQLESAKRTLPKAVQRSPVDVGFYKNSWDVQVVAAAGARGKPEVRLVNDAPYAGVLELGARPFTPPIGPLIEWARRKAGDLALGGKLSLSSDVFSVDSKGFLKFKGQASLQDDDEAAVEAFAWAVRAKIQREGLPARYVMRGLLPFAVEKLDQAVYRNLRRLAKGEFDGGGLPQR